jgi:hypothetical protein
MSAALKHYLKEINIEIQLDLSKNVATRISSGEIIS